MSLAANFGELRPNHYHMGLDIRTEKRENLPVYAAADGYVARVKVEPLGFGQAIYINHPNGYTTLYAHLNRFFPALSDYIEQQQYKARSWEVFIDIPPGLFPVKKGELIAFSGNRGGSQGPHLHFEIRKTAGDTNLNPLLFGLPVPDNTAPVIQRLAIYDRRLSTYEQSPRILPVFRVPSSPGQRGAAAFSVRPELITVGTAKVSCAIGAFDTQSGSANPNGIFQATLYDNDRRVVTFQMDHISYDNTRSINAHIDYKTRETGGPFLQHLSQLAGYPAPSIYRADASGGALDLQDGVVHRVRVEVRDAYGNLAVLKYELQYRPGAGKELPAAARVDSGKRFYPGMLDGLEAEDCAFYLAEKSLYDSVYIHYEAAGYPGAGISLPGAVSAAYRIGERYIPLNDSLLVRIRMHSSVSDPGSTDRVVMVCFNGADKDVMLPSWQEGWASARFRSFGNFQLVADKEAPVIIPVGLPDGANLSHATRIAFDVKDNLGATRNFQAWLDPTADGGGSWLCFSHDKNLAYIYNFDRHCPAGAHVLRVSVEDVAGNRTVKEYHFTR